MASFPDSDDGMFYNVLFEAGIRLLPNLVRVVQKLGAVQTVLKHLILYHNHNGFEVGKQSQN